MATGIDAVQMGRQQDGRPIFHGAGEGRDQVARRAAQFLCRSLVFDDRAAQFLQFLDQDVGHLPFLGGRAGDADQFLELV